MVGGMLRNLQPAFYLRTMLQHALPRNVELAGYGQLLGAVRQHGMQSCIEPVWSRDWPRAKCSSRICILHMQELQAVLKHALPV